VLELNKYTSHVILTVVRKLVSCHVCEGDNFNIPFQFSLGGLLLVVAVIDLLMHNVNHALGATRVPEAVASKHDKLILLKVSVDDLKVGLSGHGLVLGSNTLSSLKEQITNSPGYGKVTLNSTIINECTGGLNALSLQFIVGLMVVTELDDLTFTSEDSAGITSVGADKLSGGAEEDGSGGASDGFLLSGEVCLLQDLLFNLVNDGVKCHKSVVECLLVILLLVSLLLQQESDEFLLDEFNHFHS